MTDYQYVRVENPLPGVARVVMDRAAKRNATNLPMLYELDRAFTVAAADTAVKVIILAADGPHFSAGHDQLTRGTMDDIKTVGTTFGYSAPGIEGMMNWTREAYFDTHWRWRNIPKPLIAEVHGKVIGGGLGLMWICDVIVASDDAQFADPTVHIYGNGVEYFGHPWEFGIRKAKELLFTSGWLTAHDGERCGMINKVVSREALTETALEMARKMATQPSLGLSLSKQALNAAQDQQGFYNAMREAFMICTVAHAQMQIVGLPEDGMGEGFMSGKRLGTEAPRIE